MVVLGEQFMDDKWISRRETGSHERVWNRSGPWAHSATTPRCKWKICDTAGIPEVVSARRLAARLWQAVETTGCGGDVRWRCGLSDQLGFEFFTSSQIPIFNTEGATKWDCGYPKPVLEVKEPKADFKIVKILMDDVRREREIYQKALTLNSKLRADIARSKSLGNKYMLRCAREKAARKSLETARFEINEKILGENDQAVELRGQLAIIQKEVKNEKHRLRIMEAWGEEHARVRLADAKRIFEDKLCLISNLIADFKALNF